MVTEEFQIIVKDYVDKLNNILAINKEDCEKATNRIQNELIMDLNELQMKHPLLAHHNLSHFNDAPIKMIEIIKQNVKDKTALDCAATPACYRIQLGGVETIQPNVIDFEHQPNIVLSTSSNKALVRSDQISSLLEECLLNIILSMPIGQVHMSFVNLSLSEKAVSIIQKLQNSFFEVAFETKEVSELERRLTERAKQKLTTGRIDGPICEIVVLMDYDEHWKIMTDKFSKLFKQGHHAGIHFVLLTNENELNEFNLLNENNYFKLDNTQTFCSESCLTQQPFLLQACYDYINKSQNKDCNAQQEVVQKGFVPCFGDIETVIGDSMGHDVSFKLNSKNHPHAFVLGQSGKGKSVLLHDVIAGLFSKYSPEDIQLYLLDYKTGGVEFNRYRCIKHVKALLVDNGDEQITLEILRNLKQQMKERGKLLRESSVDDIIDYNNSHSENRMPSIVLIADECHMLFNTQNSKNRQVQNEIISIITTIAKEGRNQGVHLLFATQTLAGADIPAGIMNNITDFYLLNCKDYDSEKLVRDSSKITTGQAVGQVYYYNADNQYQFQAHNIKPELESIIKAADIKSVNNRSNGQFYFSGAQVFPFDNRIIKYIHDIEGENLVAVLGRRISLEQDLVSIKLRNDISENILLFGVNDEQQVTRTAISLLISLIISNMKKQLGYKIYVIDCINDDSYGDIIKMMNDRNYCTVISKNEHGLHLKRIADGLTNGRAEPAILFIIGQERFRELRNDMEIDVMSSSIDTHEMVDLFAGLNFSNTDKPTSSIKTFKEALTLILDHGPENGIHTILQLDKPNKFLFEEYVNSKLIFGKFKHLIMLRSDEKSAISIGLNDEIKLEQLSSDKDRLRAYYYAEEEDRYTLFSPFGLPDLELFNQLNL